MSKNSNFNPVQLHRPTGQSAIRKRSGSSTSVSQIPTVSRVTVTSNCPKILPSLSSNDGVNLSVLKNSFSSFSEAISDFLSKSIDDVSYKENLSVNLTDSDRYFTTFISFLQKQNSNLIQNRVSSLGSHSSLGTSAENLVDSLKNVMKIMAEVREKGISNIYTSIENQFKIINGNLATIENNNNNVNSNRGGSARTIHDPLIKRVRAMEKETLQIRYLIKRDHEMTNHQQILNQLMVYSRNLNSSFTNEFAITTTTNSNSTSSTSFSNNQSLNRNFHQNTGSSNNINMNLLKNQTSGIKLSKNLSNTNLNNLNSDSNNNSNNFGIVDKEKIRYSTMTACNEIIQGVKILNSYHLQVSIIFSTFDSFQNNLNPVLDQFNLPLLNLNEESTNSARNSQNQNLNQNQISDQIPILKNRKLSKENSDGNELTNTSILNSKSLNSFNLLNETPAPTISSAMTLKNILEQSKPYLACVCSDSHFVETFFQEISTKTEELLNSNFTLSSQIGEFQLKNAQLAMKSRQMESTISELQGKVSLMSSAVKEEDFLKCLKHVARRLRIFLDDRSTDFVTYDLNQMMNCVEMLSDSLDSKICQNCLEYENKEMKLREILHPIVRKDLDILPTAHLINENFTQLQNELKIEQSKFEDLMRENLEIKSELRKLNKEFPDIQIFKPLQNSPQNQANSQNPSQNNSQNSLSINYTNGYQRTSINVDEIVKHIREMKEILQEFKKQEKIKEKEKDTKSIEEFEKELSLRYSSLFSTDSKKPLLSQFEQTKISFDTQNRVYNDSQQLLREVEAVLSKQMNVKTQGTIYTSIRNLLSQFQKQENFPMKATVKVLEKKQQLLLTDLMSIENTLRIALRRDPPDEYDDNDENDHNLNYLDEVNDGNEGGDEMNEDEIKSNVRGIRNLRLDQNIHGKSKTKGKAKGRGKTKGKDKNKGRNIENLIVQVISSITQMSEELAEWSEDLLREERRKKPENIKMRATLEMLNLKLQKLLNQQTYPSQNTSPNSFNSNINSISNVIEQENKSDLSIIDTPTLVLKVSEYIDMLFKSDNSNCLFQSAVINNIFSSILKYVSEHSRKDPLKYMPEIAFKFAILQESIDALEPFANVLNDTFASFDCKLASFSPGSESFTFLRQQTSQLHSLLNTIGPSRVHSMLFLVLSKFVSLISSFLSAISSMSYQSTADNETKEKNI
ncbi:hypothetical protein TRFO_06056 [Tritrichomonas foetus]|uniref:Uncharacterized protein n=1 Tax=Tritrichomonas foetus TaxID=1144522 RepID=A0A1J4K2N3_9EUKA|nr:hypothetical protein TRFO_06056 [Tritrichomonas foetus]|eukprot:OHT05064.1 hypothetical protein TRFO_06056 [Tritrichomonas foetus]